VALKETEIKFGTDGWRAVIGGDYTFRNVGRVAQGFGSYVRKHWNWQRGIVVGYDRRFGSERFAAHVVSVLVGNGIPVHLVDRPCPTPVVAFSAARLQAAGAVMITASHNPPEDNGFKIRTATGAAVAPEKLSENESSAVDAGLWNEFNPDQAYLDHISTLIDLDRVRDREIEVVVDAMYGSAAAWLPRVLGGGLLRVSEIHSAWNPRFPGLARPEPIPPQTDELSVAVRDSEAVVGIATDGDGDRLGVVDGSGEFVDQLRTIALLAFYFLEHRNLRRPLVKTLTTSSMLERLGKIYDVHVEEVGVGMKYVAPAMTELDAIMGGEESGGYVFAPHMPERDGVVAGLYFLDLMVREGKTPSELVAMLFQKLGREYHYGRTDFRFSAEARSAIEEQVRLWVPDSIDGAAVLRRNDADGFKYYLDDESWLLIRFSGTEPLLRVYTETTTVDRVGELLAIGARAAGVEE
jgi:phosphomannomutase